MNQGFLFLSFNILNQQIIYFKSTNNLSSGMLPIKDSECYNDSSKSFYFQKC